MNKKDLQIAELQDLVRKLINMLDQYCMAFDYDSRKLKERAEKLLEDENG